MAIAPDPLEAVVAYLAADADVVSLAADRVYGAELPAEASQPVLPPTVVVQNAGGFGNRGTSSDYHQRIDVVAYGPDSLTANHLQLACMGALNRVKRLVINGTILYSVSNETLPSPGRSPTSFWPYSWTTWSVHTNYREIT